MEYRYIEFAALGLIGAILWSIDYLKLNQKAQLILPAGKFKGVNKPIRLIVFIVGILAWFSISVAMTNPRKPLKHLPSDIEVNDIFLVVDVSRSMLVDDLEPNRLEVAKLKLREFASLRPTDRIGIIIFSEKVFTLLPLTTDPTLVDQILSEIRIGSLGSGTNIGDALALAVARATNSRTKNKAIILLTDGVSNVGKIPPLNAARSAKDFNIKVYTIGLGRINSKLPIGRNSNGVKQYQNVPGGSIDIETLEEISKITGGKSFMANSEESLKEILGEIQKLEKTKINSNSRIIYDELFFSYLIFGIVLLVIVELSRKFILKEIV